MQLKDKDIDILTTLSNLRFMTTQQIHSIHGYAGKYGEKVTRRKLKELETKGLLKSWRPDIYSSKVFYLTKAGAKEVEFYHGYENVKTFQKSNKTLHQVMVTEVYVQLKKSGVRLRRFVIHPKVGDIEPDAFVEYQEGAAPKIFFLEADRATETLQILTDKLEGYKRVYEDRWYQKKIGYFPRVVFITSTDARKRSLLRLLARYPYKSMAMTEKELLANPKEVL